VVVSRRGERRGVTGQLVTAVHLVPRKSPGWVVHLYRKSADQQEEKLRKFSFETGSCNVPNRIKKNSVVFISYMIKYDLRIYVSNY
jgi:hypothetical protein